MITTGRVHISLTRAHVDNTGFPTRAAEQLVWASLAGLPDGAAVLLDLGPAKYVSERLLRLCVDGLGPACQLTIEGGARRSCATMSRPFGGSPRDCL